MSVSPLFRRDHHHLRHTDDDGLAIALAASDMSLADSSPFLASFDDVHAFDSDHMIFQFDDSLAYEPKQPMAWEPSAHDYSLSSPSAATYLPGSPESTSSQLDFGAPIAHLPPSARSQYALTSFSDVAQQQQQQHPQQDFYAQWLTDTDTTIHPSSSSPIDIPVAAHAQSHSSAASSLQAFSDNSSIFADATYALQPLPRSFSPGEDDFANRTLQGNPGLSASPSEPPLSPPVWASQLWTTPPNATQALPTTPSSTVPQTPDSEDAYATQRPRIPLRRGFRPVSELFPSSSAPSVSHIRPPTSRAYSRRAESISEHDDATVRRKKRSLVQDDEESRAVERAAGDAPLKSTLRPPKLAPSAWQLYFTDWIQRHQATSPKKLNVAQAAKEAGQEYARLSAEEKEPYRRRSQAAKEAREREHSAYMRTLTPDDIKRENAFRTAQRKAGKSRKGNLKDPNAPKKPLSAYFMFLQRIRSDPALVHEVFGDETETTKQSVLAAAKWRSMTDDERKPFLAQAEQEKLEYEAARKLYEEGTTGSPSSINFSILPNNPINSIAFPSSSFFRPVKQDPPNSESEGEDGVAGNDLTRRRAHSHV